MMTVVTGGLAVVGLCSCVKFGSNIANTITWGQRMLHIKKGA